MDGYKRALVAAVIVVAIALSCASSSAQNLLMRRANSVGNWRLYVNNSGILFNQSDAQHLMHDGVGGFWYEPSGRLDSMIFGAGLWFGGLRLRGDSLVPHVEYTYEPNHGGSGFVPGSIIYGGDAIDTSQAGRDNYRVYRSTDITGPAWPIRMIDGKPRYVNDPLARASAGPPATIGDEDVFAIYKDTDPSWAGDSIPDPLRLEVRTQVATWRSGLLKDVALIHSEMIYSGHDTLFDPVVATVVDGDIFYEGDDQLKRVRQNEGALAAVFFTANSTTDPMLGVTAFGQQGPRRTTEGLTVVRYWDIFSDPVTDSERYQFLIDTRHDLVLTQPVDARLLMSSKSDQPWAPGDTIDFDFVVYAQPASGDQELSSADSVTMLGIAEQLTTHYFGNSLGELHVRDQSQPPSFERIGDRLLVDDRSARLLDVLGREVARPTAAGGVMEFDLHELPAGAYFLSGERGVAKVFR